MALSPERDDPDLGVDPARNNAFVYATDDARGLKCPLGAHARRSYARDAKITGVARNHRILRRSSSYGPVLRKGVLEDDGADRGILFFCLQAQLTRQFEFVKTQWINEGTFYGTPAEIDPAASTASCPACGRCAGSPTSTGALPSRASLATTRT